MKLPAMPSGVRTFLLGETVWRALPTLATLYLNQERLREPLPPPTLPKAEWSRRERHGLLAASEERLRSIEGKGPGLATVTAVIAAAILLAITGGWNESTLAARAILVSAAGYGAMSLLLPLHLVGPLRRHTVHIAELDVAGAADDPEEVLADSASEAAMRNDLQNQRLSNLLDAARRELSYALLLVLLWVLLVPVTGVLRREASQPSRDHSASPAAVGGAPSQGLYVELSDLRGTQPR